MAETKVLIDPPTMRWFADELEKQARAMPPSPKRDEMMTTAEVMRDGAEENERLGLVFVAEGELADQADSGDPPPVVGLRPRRLQ